MADDQSIAQYDKITIDNVTEIGKGLAFQLLAPLTQNEEFKELCQGVGNDVVAQMFNEILDVQLPDFQKVYKTSPRPVTKTKVKDNAPTQQHPLSQTMSPPSSKPNTLFGRTLNTGGKASIQSGAPGTAGQSSSPRNDFDELLGLAKSPAKIPASNAPFQIYTTERTTIGNNNPFSARDIVKGDRKRDLDAFQSG